MQQIEESKQINNNQQKNLQKDERSNQNQQQMINLIKFHDEKLISTPSIQALLYFKTKFTKKRVNYKFYPYSFQELCNQIRLDFNLRNNPQQKNHDQQDQQIHLSRFGFYNNIFIYQQQFINFLHCIKEWSIQILSIKKNDKLIMQNKVIFGCLTRINFINLKFLSLESVNITNIQFLTFINLSNTYQINLSHNLIRSIQPMNKIMFNNQPQRQYALQIDVRRNFIQQKSFSRILFKNTIHVSLLISMISSRQTDQPYINRDISSVAKYTSWTYGYDTPRSIRSNKILQRMYPSYFKINSKLNKVLDQIISSYVNQNQQ